MNCLVLIFSRNRALQLDAAIRSYLLHCRDAQGIQVRVLYTTTDSVHSRQYDELIHEYSKYPFVRFVPEQDFRSNVLTILAPFTHVLFLVDDNVFIKDFVFQDILALLNLHSDVVGCSLRLGRNTNFSYMVDSAQDLPSFTQVDSGVLKYRWPEAQHDFGYPLEISSSMYRVGDIYGRISQLCFTNPNTLESEWANLARMFTQSHPYLLCYDQSVAFCNPLNLVQTAWRNRVGQNQKYSAQNLAEQFSQGYRINLEGYANFTPRSVHQEVELNMELQGSNSLRNDKISREILPTVSVVIPCYQQAEFLPEAVNSVVLQSYGDWEIIIVNDGSTDNTADVALSLSRKFPDKKIQLISQANKGLAETRNVGIRNSVGRYILPLDADDIIAPTMLERMVQILETRPDIGIAYPDTATFGEVSEVRQARDWSFPILCTTNILSYCALYRKEVWEAVGGYNPNMNPTYEDWDFWIGCGEKGVKGLRIPEPLFIYRVRNNTLASVGKKHDKELKARIILNHPTLYTETLKNSAREILGWNVQGSYPLNGKEIIGAPADAKDNHKTSSGIPRDLSANSSKCPLVSVIIPTKNRPDMLIDAVRSVLWQTYRHFEIIVINDGGGDIEGIISNLDTEGRIVYVRLPKSRERSFARNLGISLAQGKYIAYLDDDDRYYPQHLETLVGFLETTEHQVAYADAYRVHQVKENGRYVTKSKDLPYSQDFDGETILVQNFIPNLCLMHAKSCVEQVGGFESSLEPHEDWEFLIRLSQHYSIHHVKTVTAEFSWRMDGSTSTSARQPDFLRTRNEIYEKYKDIALTKPQVWQAQQQVLQTAPLLETRGLECSIIIPVWNKGELTKQCLTQLAKVTADVRYEVIVVDNDSTDGTKDFLATLGGDIRVITNQENRGFAKACNQGAAVAQGQYVVFLNNDTIPQDQWLSALVQEVEEHEEVGIVGSKLLYPDNTLQHAGVALSRSTTSPYHLLSGVEGNFGPVNERRELQIVTGACMLLRKALFEQVGGFDEGFINSTEDIDLCLKVRALGKKIIYQPKSWLYHLESQTPGRHDHDDLAYQRFIQRWSHQWIANEDWMAFEMGNAVKLNVVEGRRKNTVVPFSNVSEQQQWQRVRDVQALLHGKEKTPWTEMPEGETIRQLLGDPEVWPSDVGVLEWGGGVCQTLKCELEAQAFWKKILTMVDHSEARAELARSAIQAGDMREAQQHLDVLHQKFPQKVEGMLWQGVLYMQAQQYREAKQAFESAGRLDSENVKAQLGLGQAHMGLGEQREAWEVFERSLEREPDSREALNGLIQTGTVLEWWERLAEHLGRFVSRNPADCAMRFALGSVQVRAGKVGEAQQQCDMLSAVQPHFEGLQDLRDALEEIPSQAYAVAK